MNNVWFGWAWCRGKRIRYGLLREGREAGRSYGVRVTYGEETAEILDVTTSWREICGLLHALRRGRVTPITLKDVIEDRLAER